ncbi:MAG: aspartate kinase [Pirellulales bacterium]|nr:aspartate kinase [Pirellulales bacterium]
MPFVVQKFGGTSLADAEMILAAARKAVRAHQEGNQVVVVVSAMGQNTDLLIQLAHQITENPSAREMDMLLSTGEQVSAALTAMAIHSLGFDAVSLTGTQIGIRTDSSHTKARIRSISTERIQEALRAGQIVIATGFQGVDKDLAITTLGRGGSDTTAVALAAVLGADACEIYTDVDGVYTTDPRILPEARQMPRVSYDEMLELASLGAGVMHSRSIEAGKRFNVPIIVRSSFSDVPGTVIGLFPEARDRPVSGAALTKFEAQISIGDVPDTPGASLKIFSKIAAVKIPVDMVVQNIGAEGKATISFTVLQDDLSETLTAVTEAAEELGAGCVTHDENVSKVSIVGLGMATQTGVADRMFRALAESNINIQVITTSEIKVSVLVQREQALTALRAVHREFELEKPPTARAAFGHEKIGTSTLSPVDIVARLRQMEELTIEGVRLDDTQARVTIESVPDRPGVSADVFEAIAARNLFVDMIVQSIGYDGKANLSFTIPQDTVSEAVAEAERLAEIMGAGHILHEPKIAILSVLGIGMRSHTDVAIRMFQALADADINVDMINTSEMRINVVVAVEKGPAGLAALEKAFADVLR